MPSSCYRHAIVMSSSCHRHTECVRHAKCKKLGDVTTINLTVLRAGVTTDGGNTFAINVVRDNTTSHLRACTLIGLLHGYPRIYSPTLAHPRIRTHTHSLTHAPNHPHSLTYSRTHTTRTQIPTDAMACLDVRVPVDRPHSEVAGIRTHMVG